MHKTQMSNKIQKKTGFLNSLIQGVFWGFNVPFVLIFIIWIIDCLNNPQTVKTLQQLNNFIPKDILISFIFLFLMPIFSIIMALVTKVYRQSKKLFQILFGFELPIMAFTLGRLIFLKSLTPVNILFLSTAVLSVVAYLIYIFRKSFENKYILILHMLIFQAAIVVGFYASLLMFFFLPIIVAFILQDIINYFFMHGLFGGANLYMNFWQLFGSLIWMITFCLLFLFLIISPFVGLLTYWKAAIRVGKSLEQKTNLSFTRLIKWGFSLVYIFIIFALAYQGSLILFYNQVNFYKSAKTFKERSYIASDILNQKDFVQDRLVDTYLAHYRYLTDDGMTLLSQAYQDKLNMDPIKAKSLQKWFTLVAFPFIYNGKFEEDVKKADKYYQDIFDEPIQLAENKKVVNTLATSFNFSMDQMKSSVLDREDKDVRLVQRTVSVQPESTNQFATVTIEEEYENMTNSNQEVFYVFSLPQDSVMTDLKLGSDLQLGKEQLEILKNSSSVSTPTSSLSPTSIPSTTPQVVEHKNQGEIAAKGAVNQTFENQYQPRIDPAILEQVGPAQYKLRVYPIPVKEENMNNKWQRELLTEPVKNQKVRFSYVTEINANGKVALPKIIEKRNIFSNSNTSFVLNTTNNQQTKILEGTQNIQIIDKDIPVCGTALVELKNKDYTTYYISHLSNPWIKSANITYDCKNQFKGVEERLKNKKIAILADSSYSMGIVNWEKYLNQQLSLHELLDNNMVDLYYFNDFISQPINLNQQRNNPKIWNQISFGKTDRLHALEQIQGKYDFVLMFTDSSEADNPGKTDFSPHMAQPIYMVYKNNHLPRLTDNLTYYLQANESRMIFSGREALQNYVIYDTVKKNVPNSFILVGNMGTWIVISNRDNKISSLLSAKSISVNEPLAKILVHRQIEGQMKEVANNLNNLTILDNFNRTAQSSGIVTPFSSFIVLVTSEQKEQLKQASLVNGRYVVNYDIGQEQLIEPTSGGMLGTSAVPEPEEWILMFTGFGIILFLGRYRIRNFLNCYHA